MTFTSALQISSSANVIVRVFFIILLLIGAVYMTLLPSWFAQNVYSDENALLVNNARTTIDDSDVGRVNEYRRSFAQRNTTADAHAITLWRNLHARTIRYDDVGDGGVVAAHISAFRADSVECIMLISQYSETETEALIILTALAARLALSAHLARDVVLVSVRADDRHALHRFFRRYRQRKDSKQSLRHTLHAGVPLAAIGLVVSARGDGDESVGLYTTSSRGLQANLDLVATVALTAQQHRIPLTVNGNRGTDNAAFIRALLVAGDVATFEALHDAPLTHNIDALTLVATTPHNDRRLLELLQSVSRSLNNLIERLHHSTNFYCLLSDKRFISMNKYIYAFALFAAPIPLSAMFDLYSMRQHHWTLTITLVAAMFTILATAASTPALLAANHFYHDFTDAVVVAVVVTLMIIVFAAHYDSTKHNGVTDGSPSAFAVERVTMSVDTPTMRAVTALSAFVILCPLALLSFPTAILTAIAVSPLTVIMPTSSGAVRGIQWAILALTSPPALTAIASLLPAPLTLWPGSLATVRPLHVAALLVYAPMYLTALATNAMSARYDKAIKRE